MAVLLKWDLVQVDTLDWQLVASVRAPSRWLGRNITIHFVDYGSLASCFYLACFLTCFQNQWFVIEPGRPDSNPQKRWCHLGAVEVWVPDFTFLSLFCHLKTGLITPHMMNRITDPECKEHIIWCISFDQFCITLHSSMIFWWHSLALSFVLLRANSIVLLGLGSRGKFLT